MRFKHIAMIVGGVSLGLFLWTRWTTEHSDHEGKNPHLRKPLQGTTHVHPPSDSRPTPRKTDSYSLFKSGGEISDKALDAAGLPHSSGGLVKEMYQGVLVDIQKDIASRVIAQTAPTDRREGVYTFAIKGDPEKSEVYIEQIRQKFTNEFGGRAADKLLLGLRRSMSHGKFGRNDAVITIEKKGEDAPHNRIVIEYFDVDSGKLVEEWQATEKELRREYVDVFDDVLSASGMENDG